MEEVKKGKETLLEEDYNEDKLLVGRSAEEKKGVLNLFKSQGSGKEVNVGELRREILPNGQRIVSLTLDKEMLKQLKQDKDGNYTISLKSNRFQGDDFLSQQIKLNAKELAKLKPNENGQVKLVVFEKHPGGELSQKRELEVKKDSEEVRKQLQEINPKVKYTGEEKVWERQKLFDAELSPRVKFIDVYNRMTENEKGAINQKDNGDLKKFIEENRKPLSTIEESIRSQELDRSTKEGQKVTIRKGDSELSATCAGIGAGGNVVYYDKDGQSHNVNQFRVPEEVSLNKKEKEEISLKSFRQGIEGTNLHKDLGKEEKEFTGKKKGISV